MNSERLTLLLDSTEMQALRKAAKADLRRPHDQARYILRTALLAATLSTDANAEHVTVPSPVCTSEPMYSP